MSFTRPRALATTTTTGAASADVALPADAEDTISSVSWSPTANHLAAASWDGKVRVYDVASDGTGRGAAILNAEGPILSCDWAKDGTMVVAGGADKKSHLLHLATGQQITVGTHDQPIRGVRFVDIPGSNGPIIASASWDKTVKFWDMRQPNPLASLNCAERVYSMDAKAGLLVIATAERHIQLVDLQNPTVIARTQDSPLKAQTKAVSAFPDGKGWGTASIEGRCGINAVEEKDPTGVNFTFRCHREQPDLRKVTKVYAVNDVQFHPVQQSTFSTAGADGTFHFWDRAAHARLKGYPSVGGSITSTAFNRDGTLFAYAVGYDWSQGFSSNNAQYPNKLMLHTVSDEDSTPRKK
ncbi:WD40-repeat-containing domain protein [Xylariales sp. AK1849]|nr:WD40-repeat-containing domain protein [Xylariales sp. AK1849]